MRAKLVIGAEGVYDRISVLPFLALLLLVTGPAAHAAGRGEPRSIGAALSVRVDDGCITADALALRLASWLSSDTIDAGIELELNRANETLTFRLRRPGQPLAERRFEVLPAGCESRLRAVSLAMALAIDHTLLERAGREEGAAPGPPLSSSPPASDAAVAQPAPASLPVTLPAAKAPSDRIAPVVSAPRPAGRFALSAGAALVGRLLPSVQPAAVMGAEVQLQRHWSLHARALATGSDEAPLGSGLSRTRLLAGGLSGCWQPVWERIGGSACGGALLGRMTATGAQFAKSLAGAAPWAAASAGVGVRYPARSSVYVRFHVDAVWTLARPSFHVMTADGDIIARRELPRIGTIATFLLAVSLP